MGVFKCLPSTCLATFTDYATSPGHIHVTNNDCLLQGTTDNMMKQGRRAVTRREGSCHCWDSHPLTSNHDMGVGCSANMGISSISRQWQCSALGMCDWQSSERVATWRACSSDGTHSCIPELRRRSIRDMKRVKLPVLMFKVLYEAPDFPLAPSVAVESAHRSVFILMTCF
jgi:hypothetical protein